MAKYGTTLRVLISLVLFAQIGISAALWAQGIQRPAVGWLVISLGCWAFVFIGTSK